MHYRLALDLGSTSLGWAMLSLSEDNTPKAIIKAGVRIFSDGRNPKDGSSLAVTRRAARGMRRRRDRLLRRKERMMEKLIAHGFFPADAAARKALETLNPYVLRAKGLDEALTAHEFARALFHINQRRGFQSNRKTDKKDNDSGALKQAIHTLRAQLDATGSRTVGEWFWKERMQRKPEGVKGQGVRARYRETPFTTGEGKKKIDKSYDLYIDRAMVEHEFDTLWAAQARFNPALFSEAARGELKDTLLFQRPLRPVKPGRCTLIPEEPRAPLALPSTQRFRIYQEVNHLRLLDAHLQERPLTLAQRDVVVAALEGSTKVTFDRVRKLLKLGGDTQFNLEDAKRTELKGNTTTVSLSKKELFGPVWQGLEPDFQDDIVWQLINEESEVALIAWLVQHTGVDLARAEAIAGAGLPEGYGSLSRQALARIVPALREPDESDQPRTYDKAVQAAGFSHHSDLDFDFPFSDDEVAQVGERIVLSTGEVRPVRVFKQLPYYGRALQRHVAFAKDNPRNEEEQFGKIANPTVHIGLNQVRVVVNALIRRYGHPTEVVVELARELKQSREQKQETQKRQADNQKRNARIRQSIAQTLGIGEERVRAGDVQKWILWEELSFDPAERRCPYSGAQISASMLLSDQVEIEHILPFSRTLDDSLNNRTVAMRQANRVKRNRTPWEARADFEAQGWSFDSILLRADRMPRAKRKRFAPDGYEQWLGDDKDFLARALNDTRYLSRVATEYLRLVCPGSGTRVIPGQMTAMLRGLFGLNTVLSTDGRKNRNDHRHHAVDACVIGVTDQGMMKRFADANSNTRADGIERLVKDMPMPWETYRAHVERAVDNIWVSHRPDHGYQGEIFDATIYGLRGTGKVTYRQVIDGKRTRPLLNREVTAFSDGQVQNASLQSRHGVLTDGQPKPYMGLWSRSNYCLEVERADDGSWKGKVLERFRAYAIVAQHGEAALRSRLISSNGQPLVMRLLIDDTVLMEIDGQLLLLRVLKINSTGATTFVLHNETNISARYIAKLAAQKAAKKGDLVDQNALDDNFFQKSISPDSMRTFKARRVTVSPIGELRDPGFKE